MEIRIGPGGAPHDPEQLRTDACFARRDFMTRPAIAFEQGLTRGGVLRPSEVGCRDTEENGDSDGNSDHDHTFKALPATILGATGAVYSVGRSIAAMTGADTLPYHPWRWCPQPP
jgi:hypothetical protein